MSRPRVGFRPCTIDGCANNATQRKGTLCSTHYFQERRKTMPLCLVESCGRKATNVGTQLCENHYHKTPQGRAVVLRAKYGLEPGDYEKLMAAQNNSCAICGVKESVGRGGQLTRLCVDHNHETGQVRGLLCAACNKGLGIFKDDFRLVANAATYLIKKDKTVMKKMQETR
jgi:hypothetical protein